MDSALCAGLILQQTCSLLRCRLSIQEAFSLRSRDRHVPCETTERVEGLHCERDSAVDWVRGIETGSLFHSEHCDQQ